MPTLKKNERIGKAHEFKRVYREGKKVVNKYFVLYAAQQENDNTPNRLGLSVSKGISKKAVIRNRIKRLFRESYRIHKDTFKKGYDIVIVARRKIVELDFYELNKYMVDAIHRVSG